MAAENTLFPTRSEEKGSQGFPVPKCNNDTGREWDTALARQLNPISNLLNIKRDRVLRLTWRSKQQRDESYCIKAMVT